MPRPRKQYRLNEQGREKMAEIEENAAKLAEKYNFYRSVREMQAQGHSHLEIAFAFIMMGYNIPRLGRPEDRAKDAFNIFTYFAGRRIESNIEHKRRQRLSKLH